jgi:hypothetical protein
MSSRQDWKGCLLTTLNKDDSMVFAWWLERSLNCIQTYSSYEKK